LHPSQNRAKPAILVISDGYTRHAITMNLRQYIDVLPHPRTLDRP
jgi:hypothetical protein